MYQWLRFQPVFVYISVMELDPALAWVCFVDAYSLWQWQVCAMAENILESLSATAWQLKSLQSLLHFVMCFTWV
jgi:hypothetical protein